MKKVVTLLFLHHHDEVLLAMKKRGHGVGKWNGAGGKVEPGETVEAAAIRECQEEVSVTPLQPRLVGRLQFYELTDPDFHHDCHIFVSERWEGEPVETEEMRPRWFHRDGVPYSSMWPDDILWLPHMLNGKSFEGSVTTDNGKLRHHEITIKNGGLQ